MLISEQLSQFTTIVLTFLASVLWNAEFKVKEAKYSGRSINPSWQEYIHT